MAWLSPRDVTARPRGRLRRRYVRAIVQWQGFQPSKEDLIEAIRTSICEAFGLKGFADVSPRLVSYDQGKGVAIVRCTHQGVDQLCAALTLINRVKGTAVSVNPERISGLMRTLRNDELLK